MYFEKHSVFIFTYIVLEGNVINIIALEPFEPMIIYTRKVLLLFFEIIFNYALHLNFNFLTLYLCKRFTQIL